MKLVFVCKRSPQQRDLMERPYGRFHHLPAGLAARGHEVTLLLLGHAGQPPQRDHFEGVERIAFDVRAQGPAGAWRALRDASAAAEPDWVIGCSDAWAGCIAHRLARRQGARLAIDAYDNYESYMPWNLPLHALWRRAIRAADLVTAAGPQLAALLARSRPGAAPVQVLPMAADPAFKPLDRANCRAELGLDAEGAWLGYCGGWGAARGTEVIAEVLAEVRRRRPDVGLLLTGHPPPVIRSLAGVQSLGYLPDRSLPAFIGALDAALVVTAETAFGKYSYPAKLCEAMAGARPVAATDTAPVRWMLGKHSQFLAPVGDAAALAARALEALEAGPCSYEGLPSWEQGAASLERWLRESPAGNAGSGLQ